MEPVLSISLAHLIDPVLSIEIINGAFPDGKSQSVPGKSITPESLFPTIYEFPKSSTAKLPVYNVEVPFIGKNQAQVPLLNLLAT